MATQSPSVVGAIGGIVGGILNDPQVKQSIISELFRLIAGLFHHDPKPAPAPVVAITKPTPAPVQPAPNFPDDHFPVPVTHARKVTTVTLYLARAQYSKERFPEKYTDDNPMGLYSNEDLRAIQAGDSKLNWGSKFWLDKTSRDAEGHEFLRPDMLAFGLAFKNETHVGDCFIKGHGADPGTGAPLPGYETNDTDAIGHGETAWLSSLGSLVQFKSWPASDGKSFECWGSVDGVESNRFTISVS